jgi:thioredoxin reductase
MPERLIVIGGDAAGMSAASQAKRLRGDDLTVIGFERGEHSSYSACGIPYWIAGDVSDEEQLIVRSPEEHRRNGIDLRMLTEVEQIDLDAGRVAVRDLTRGRSYTEGFDHLVIATGAARCARRCLVSTPRAYSACRLSTMARRYFPTWRSGSRGVPWWWAVDTSALRWPRHSHDTAST